jgi:outer membrane biosynthesis protein TonB
MANPDVFTIGAILILIVGAACFYLYTRIKQVEKKVALVEGILLDLKMAAEASFLDFPARRPDTDDDDEDSEDEEETPFLPTLPEEETDLPVDEMIETAEEEQPTKHIEITEFKADEEEESPPVQPVQVTKSSESVTPDLESMSVKELQVLAKSKGITVGKAMRKNDIIKAIHAAETPNAAELVEQFNSEPSGISATSSLMTAGSLDFVTLDE